MLASQLLVRIGRSTDVAEGRRDEVANWNNNPKINVSNNGIQLITGGKASSRNEKGFF